MRSEIAKVQSEIVILRDEYLPAFCRSLHEIEPDSLLDQLRTQPSPSLSSWQRAVTRLGDLLPLSTDDIHISPFDAEDLKEFMFQEASPGYSVSDNGIWWRIGLFVSLESACCWLRYMGTQDYFSEENFVAALPKIKTWIMGLPVDDCLLYNVLCMVLPLIADIDPPFAKLALDLDTWRSVVNANAALSEKQRQKALGMIDHGYFRHAVNNALLHVLGAIGNNHFMLIRDYLDHPCLYGHYTGLMPHYLFAVLFEKVRILGQLAGGDLG